MIIMKYLKYVFLTLILLFSVIPLIARDKAKGDWSDLTAGERKYYGSEKEEKNATYAFFLEKENWEGHYSFMFFWMLKYTDFPKYSSLRLWPFYYKQKSKIDNRKRSWGFGWPLLFYYHSIDGPEELTVHVPVYYSSIKKNETDRSLFYLFWWGHEKRDSDGYRNSYVNLFPLYYQKSYVYEKYGIEGSRLLFLPFFYRSKRASETGDSSTTSRFNFSLLHYYDSFTKTDKEGGAAVSTTTWWFPLLPLTYHHTGPDGGHRNFLWLFDYSWISTGQEDRLKRLWIVPLFFMKKGAGEYTHVLPPLYMSFKNTHSGYRHIFPLYFSWEGRESRYDYRLKKYVSDNYDSFLSIFCSRFKKYRTGEDEKQKLISDTLWIGPFIPFVYYSSEDNTGTHKNMFWLIDWKRNSRGEMKRFWFIPVWYYSFGDKGYNHILFPVYMSFRWKDGDYYRHLLPLFFAWKDSRRYFTYKNKERTPVYYESNSLISILYSRFTKKKATGESAPEVSSDTFWIGPFIPFLYYSSEDSDGIHRNFLWLVDWKKNPRGDLDRFWFIPFVFYKSGDGGYRHFFPFYLRSSGWTESEGSSFGLLHYHRWSESENRIWIWPYYARYDLEKKTYFSFFFPLGVTWKSEKSSGDIFLPVLFNYKSKTRSYHVNILGLSKTAALGPASPDISVDVGKYRGNWYLDTDLSWLYDVFSISSRITLKNPFKKKRDISPSDLAGDNELMEDLKLDRDTDKSRVKTSITKQKDVSRNTSEFFFGWRVLFGWMAYERADTKRHFRILPLSWITYDTESDDELIAFPPLYLSYKSVEDDSEYFVVFPLYGSQRQGKSYSRGYLLNLYWDEYDDEKKLREKTFLWPLINCYSSPEKSGWRVFPLIWRKWRKEKGIVTSKIISPLHYSHYKTDSSDNSTLYKFIINPFYFSRKKVKNGTTNESTFIPLLPLYYSSSRSVISRTDDEPELTAKGRIIKEKRDGRSYLFPFYYSTSSGMKMTDGTESEDYSLLIPLSLIYYKSSRYPASTVIYKDYSLFVLGFNFYREKDEWGNGFLWGALWNYRKNDKTDFSRLNFLFGLLSFSRSGESSRTWFFPFYYNSSSPGAGEFSLLLGLYKSYHNRSEERSYLKVLWGLFWYSSFRDTEYSSLTGYRAMETKKKRNWLIPLYYYTESSGGGGYRSSTHFSLLHYRSRETYRTENSEKYSSTTWFPILPLVYWNRSYNSPADHTTHWNILGLIDRKTSADNSYNRSFFLPLFYKSDGSYNSGGGRFSFLALPLLLSGYSRTPESSSRMVLGTYWHRSNYYERQNLYYLFDHRIYKNTDQNTEKEIYNYLFTGIHYEINPQVKKFKMFWGALMSYRGYTHSDRYEVSILFNIINRERGKDFSYSHFFPLYYYKNYDDPDRGWYFLSPVTLSYFSKDKEGDLDLALLGIIYYRNNNIAEQKDKRTWLGGTLWYEVKRPERGYHSQGMFWSGLWDYETESETGFKKFSILKGLYKRVEYKGETRHTFFWIF